MRALARFSEASLTRDVEGVPADTHLVPVIAAAKVRPLASLTIDALTRAMDELDAALRAAVPEVADVYIDVTAYRSEPAATGRSTGSTT